VLVRLFEGEEAVLNVIERIVARLGLRVDATSPWVDARLPDGSRVQTRFLSASFLAYWILLVLLAYSITL
jgi:Flp pilus assembly CpaF family ATPase